MDRKAAMREALRSISRDAGRARMGDRAKEKPHHSFMISIGMGPADHTEPDQEPDADADDLDK